MINRYKLRNYDCHHDNGYRPPVFEASDVQKAQVISDSLYDRNVGVTHCFLHTNKGAEDDRVRLVCDVELAMSTSEDIRSLVSPEMQSRLRLGLQNQPKTNSASLSDDQLMRSVPANFGLERDEMAAIAKSQLDCLAAHMDVNNVLNEPAPSPAESTPSEPPASVDSPSTEP